MKLYEILKIGGSVIAGLAGIGLIFSLFSELLKHPLLIGIIIIGGLTYFAGNYFKKTK